MLYVIFVSSAFLFFIQDCNTADNGLDVKIIESKFPELTNEASTRLQGIWAFIQRNGLSENFPFVEKYKHTHNVYPATTAVMDIARQIACMPHGYAKMDSQQRRKICELYLMTVQFLQNLSGDPIKSDDVPRSNIAPNVIVSDGSDPWQIYICGMSPESIRDPKIREDFEKEIARNEEQTRKIFLQTSLMRLLECSQKQFSDIVLITYSHESQIEIIELLEKYQYPVKERIHLLCELGIVYKGFRTWESTDGLFKTTAKFIFYNAKVKEATLERENGKQTTIEWSALRKEDQEYIRRQIELDQKKLKE